MNHVNFLRIEEIKSYLMAVHFPFILDVYDNLKRKFLKANSIKVTIHYKKNREFKSLFLPPLVENIDDNITKMIMIEDEKEKNRKLGLNRR